MAIIMNYLQYAKSGIHIKKSHEGKFTDYCGGKVTEECIRRGKSSPNAAVRRMATFAKNARTWKHADGGTFERTAVPEYISSDFLYTTHTPQSKNESELPSAQEITPVEQVKHWAKNVLVPIQQELPKIETSALIRSTPISLTDASKLPRGLRNNNPGNLRISNAGWQGAVARTNNTDGAFEQFETMAYGYRAMIKLIRGYIINKHLDTIRSIISRYAPSNENNTNGYIKHVAQLSGINPDTKINPNDKNTIIRIVAAMSRIENGVDANLEDIEAGWDLL